VAMAELHGEDGFSDEREPANEPGPDEREPANEPGPSGLPPPPSDSDSDDQPSKTIDKRKPLSLSLKKSRAEYPVRNGAE